MEQRVLHPYKRQRAHQGCHLLCSMSFNVHITADLDGHSVVESSIFQFKSHSGSKLWLGSSYHAACRYHQPYLQHLFISHDAVQRFDALLRHVIRL